MVIAVGTLAIDGPATPHQISLVLPVTGAVADSATATCRYKKSSSSTWITGHPLYRVRPSESATPQAGSAVEDCFAWPILDLDPATSYDTEITVTEGAEQAVKILTTTTRAIPPPAGAPNKTANSVATINSQLSGLVAGDVLEIAAGTYNLSSAIAVSQSGSSGSPIYIRGASRTGTILSRASGALVDWSASHVIFENMTLQGAGTDGGRDSGHIGIDQNTTSLSRITIRDLRILGVDEGINFTRECQEALIYNNTLTGNNLWQTTPTDFLETGITWDDEGIKIPGQGNCIFNNTIKGFGDSCAYASHITGALSADIRAIHFYRNEIHNSCDDAAEVDHARRNCTFYDNRIHNSMTFVSLDPLYGGPFLAARNISINTGRSPGKFNNTNTGYFLYNNTILRTTGTTDHNLWGWVQYNNGTQEHWGFRNNLFVYRGGGTVTWRFDPTGNTKLDFTHNTWYPDQTFRWDNSGGSFASLAAAYSGLGTTTAVFSGQAKRHEQDNITVSAPWTVTITLGSDFKTEIVTHYVPTLSGGGAAKNSGVSIANITDGFTGASPDRGAVIAGRALPLWGDTFKARASNLNVGEWFQLPNTAQQSVVPSPVPSGDPMSKHGRWCSFVADRRDSRMYSVAGGGHNDYAGNEVDMIDLEADVPAWAQIEPPTAAGNVTNGTDYYADGKPSSRHSYYGVTFDEARNRVVLFGGFIWSTAGLYSNAVSSFNVSTQNYDASTTHPNDIPVPHGNEWGRPCTYDPDTGNAYLTWGSDVRRWNASDSTWTTLSVSGTGPGGQTGIAACAAWDSTRSTIFVLGGIDNEYVCHKCAISGNSGVWSAVTLTGSAATTIDNFKTTNAMDFDTLTYCQDLDVFFLNRGDPAGTVYQITADGYVATTYSTVGGSGVPDGRVAGEEAGPYNKFIYLPNLGGCVYSPDYNLDTWFLKTANVAAAAEAGQSGTMALFLA